MFGPSAIGRTALIVIISKIKTLNVDGPTIVFVYIESVINPSTRPESFLRKIHVSIAFYLSW